VIQSYELRIMSYELKSDFNSQLLTLNS
jgi:hypothetical protein